MPADPLQQQALRRALQARQLACTNVLNLARTIFKPGTTVKYKVTKELEITNELGDVIEVKRDGIEVLIEVQPVKARKHKIVKVEDVLGVMSTQEAA